VKKNITVVVGINGEPVFGEICSTDCREVELEYDVKPDGNIDILTCDGCVLDRAAQQEIDRIKKDRNYWKTKCIEEVRTSGYAITRREVRIDDMQQRLEDHRKKAKAELAEAKIDAKEAHKLCAELTKDYIEENKGLRAEIERLKRMVGNGCVKYDDDGHVIDICPFMRATLSKNT